MRGGDGVIGSAGSATAGRRFEVTLLRSDEIDELSYVWVRDTLVTPSNAAGSQASRGAASSDVVLTLAEPHTLGDGRALNVGGPAQAAKGAASTIRTIGLPGLAFQSTPPRRGRPRRHGQSDGRL